MTKKTNSKKKLEAELPKRDITSYVTKIMLSGNVTSLGIPREDIVDCLEKYCEANPRVDATAMPVVGVSLKGDPDGVRKAVLALAKKHLRNNGAVFSKGYQSVLIFGKAAKELVSKSVTSGDAERLKTKVKVLAGFPLNRKLDCFGGEKISDYIK